MGLPNFQELLPLVDVACRGAYEPDSGKAADLFAQAGMILESIVNDEDRECYVYIARYLGARVFAVRGTQFLSGFSLTQLLDNERLGGVPVPGRPGLAMDGYATALFKVWEKDLKCRMAQKVFICGHSMGGIRSLLLAGRVPAVVPVTVVALAPPKGMTQDLGASVRTDHPDLVIVGRADDFALNHPLIAPEYCQPGPIVHLHDGAADLTSSWPWYDEDVFAHDAEKYLADWKALAGKTS